MITKRKNIKRVPNGKMEAHLEGIDKFSKKVATELLAKYSEVDFFDLMYQFESAFRYQYSRAMARETIEE